MKLTKYILLILGFILISECEVLAHHLSFDSQRLIVKSNEPLEYDEFRILEEDLFVISFDSISQTEETYERLLTTPGVEWVEPDLELSLNVMDTQTITSWSDEFWGMDYLGINSYRDYLIQEEKDDELVVAVIDTGIDPTHPLFENKLSDFGYNFVNRHEDPFDDSYNSHGTHVAGIISKATAGLDNIKLLPLKVLDSRGKGTVSALVESVKYAKEAEVDIINLSLGLYPYYHSKALEMAILEAITSGITFVIASGNDNIDTMNSCPSHLEDAIIVSAMDSSLQKAVFSNYGAHVDLVAPGVDIYSTVAGGGFGYLDGTSMAAPHISAMAALLKLNNPTLMPHDIEEILIEIADDLGEVGWDPYFGYGVPILSKLLPGRALTGIVLEVDTLDLKVGERMNLNVLFIPTHATITENLSWSSSNESVVMVNDGELIAKQVGKAVIEVRTGTHVASCEVTVEESQIELQSKELSEKISVTEQSAIKEESHNDYSILPVEPIEEEIQRNQQPISKTIIVEEVEQLEDEEPQLVTAFEMIEEVESVSQRTFEKDTTNKVKVGRTFWLFAFLCTGMVVLYKRKQ